MTMKNWHLQNLLRAHDGDADVGIDATGVIRVNGEPVGTVEEPVEGLSEQKPQEQAEGE